MYVRRLEVDLLSGDGCKPGYTVSKATAYVTQPGCVLNGTQVLLLVTTLTHRGTDTGTVRAIDGSVVHGAHGGQIWQDW